MSILVGIGCFAIATVIVCSLFLAILDAIIVVPLKLRTVYDVVDEILKWGLFIGVVTIVLIIAIFFVLCGITAILY